ncbi:MAG: hypothetical protein L3J10_04760 [Sulfurimonas sp.]|nr:hypothetical protein [Sulfurimonas sp.]
MDIDKIDIFLKLTESLSRYRRAELKDENNNENLIEELYVDPLENDLILKTMLQNNTTLLIGRKGTGKSTIINRFQHEIRKSDTKLSLYIDVKALFEQSKKTSFGNIKNDFSLSQMDIERLSLYKDFVTKVIDEVKKELKKNLFTNPVLSFIFQNGMSKKNFEKELDALFINATTSKFIDITSKQEVQSFNTNKLVSEKNQSANATLSTTEQAINVSLEHNQKNENKNLQEFTQILGRYFNIIELMNQLKELLSKLSIQHVFICLDDMSEIDKESMEIFTEFIIAPLNNLSDEFFKFKISLYPSRDYLPSIDRQKVRTYTLDYYDLYSISNIEKVEESAIKYTKRLIEKRFKYYFGNNVEMGDFFDLSNLTMDNFYKILFQISSNVPRIMGKILEIALVKANSLNKKINKKILQEASKQHYTDDIEYVLTKSEYIEYKSYDEAFEQYHLLDLLKSIILKAKENKKKIGTSIANIFKQYTTNTAPSNYLYINEELESVLKTLEFNFFITKYSQQKDREGNDISVFSLNYGLCMDNNIIYDEKSDRKFRIERVFDYNKLLNKWMNDSKELVCTECNFKYPIEQKDVFVKFKMPCTSCGKVVELKPVINEKQKNLFLKIPKIPKKEFEILNTLNNKSPLRAYELGLELDRTYQSITYSVGENKKIKNKKFIERIKKSSKPYFSITENGKKFLQGK